MATDRAQNVEPAASALMSLGFSEMEALAYLFLLRSSPATGYRVARGTGRTAANIYNTLESLEARGAVMLEHGEPKTFRAVPPDELLGAMEAAFTTRRRLADAALKSVHARSSDERVYRLSTPDQVFERCRTVLRTVEHVALLDAFPDPLSALRPDLEAAAARGVRVAVQVYEPILLPGVEVIASYQSDVVRGRWAGEWINIVGDALVQVQALLEPGCQAVRHAAWSRSAFLAFIYHSGLLGELTTSALRRAMSEGAAAEELKRIVERMDDFKHAVQTEF